MPSHDCDEDWNETWYGCTEQFECGEVEINEGWYSCTEQFSPPHIEYVSTATHPTIAICQFTSVHIGMFDIHLIQLPGKMIQVRGEMKYGGGPPNRLDLRINELGRTNTTTAIECSAAATGEEYNPLTEKDKYGGLNLY